jgi:hypothetical protein
MICYSLVCSKSHTFNSWFASTEAFNKLKKQGFLSCAVCGTLNVEKAIMAPNILPKNSKTSKKKTLKDIPSSSAEKSMADLKAHLQKNSEDVGSNFAVIAREMHAGETPERNIHGRASLSEAKSLSEEGVPIIPLPWVDRKTN